MYSGVTTVIRIVGSPSRRFDMELRDITCNEWMAFAGAEDAEDGRKVQIGYLKAMDWVKGDELCEGSVTVIVDIYGIGIYGDEIWFTRDCGYDIGLEIAKCLECFTKITPLLYLMEPCCNVEAPSTLKSLKDKWVVQV
jgi:hypothetical protein